MIKITDKTFELHTDNTSYVFAVSETGHLEHLYYGVRLRGLSAGDFQALTEKVHCQPGNMIAYDKEHPTVMLENLCLEVSGTGKGDIRDPFIEIEFADGSRTCDFLFESAEVLREKAEYETLPGSYGASENEHLSVTLKEAGSGIILELHYYVYSECDVISRSAKLINSSGAPVRLERLMSAQLDLPDAGYVVSSFTGAWAREMEKHDTPVNAGKFEISSSAGSSSNRANPFFMLCSPQACEEAGECFGINLIYSGNHYEAVSVNSFGKTRVLCGINPLGFEFLLEPGGCFEAPEAVFTFSAAGHRQLSFNMHGFIREHIIRGKWKNRERPVLLNSWEACYFKFNESKLLKLAKAAKDAGIELFVLDDGWFGKRSDDSSSLGDWYVNKEKLPGGLGRLARKINDLGLEFGIWAEPEMVSRNSNLYRAHPDWALEIPGREHSEGRNQRVLDLSNPEVVEWLARTLSRVFSSANISYVKWDMNRIFSDVYSPALPPERQGEVPHRYMTGLYKLLGILTEKFPDILFEGCASGGGRFDLGMLCYFSQIWGSDNTDPICRAKIQEGYSYGYPLSCVSAHVSASPNHQTLRRTPLNTRFAVAAFGVLGYECNLLDLGKHELDEIREQIKLYKKWRPVLQNGNFYRGESGNIRTWTCVLPPDEQASAGLTGSASHTPACALPSEARQADKTSHLSSHTQVCAFPSGERTAEISAGDPHAQVRTLTQGEKAVGLILQELVQPNWQYHCYKACGLDPDAKYHFYNIPREIDIREFGDLANAVSPVHIKDGSILQSAAAGLVRLPGETEDYIVSGDVLMNAGVKLKSAFTASGISEDVRLFQDFAARMYFMEKNEN